MSFQDTFPTAINLEAPVLREYTSPFESKGQLAKTRIQVKKQVTSCAACGLAAECIGPVPYRGPSAPACVAMGEAPGMAEDRQRRPFVGKSGQYLDKAMRKVGIDIERVAYMNVVSCFPNDDGKPKRPTDYQVTACRPNMRAQLNATVTPYVLLVGNTALNTFRNDLRISRVHGIVMFWGARIVMPIYHPAAALRGNVEARESIVRDLDTWRKVIEGEVLPGYVFGVRCVECKGSIDRYDKDGVPYCLMHLPKVKKKKRRRKI